MGFFERCQALGETAYWIPFLYRDGLGLVQGTEAVAGDQGVGDEEAPVAETGL